jgi:hypothetical protein
MIISEPETIVSHSEIINADIRTAVYISEIIISDTRTAVSLMEALISVVEKMVSEAETIFSATDTVFLEADTAFAVSEKTVGGAPAVVFHQKPTRRRCEKIGGEASHAPREYGARRPLPRL